MQEIWVLFTYEVSIHYLRQVGRSDITIKISEQKICSAYILVVIL